MKAIVVLMATVLGCILRPSPRPDNSDFRMVATYDSQ